MYLCCRGWQSIVCIADRMNHWLLGERFNLRLCDWHDRVITGGK